MRGAGSSRSPRPAPAAGRPGAGAPRETPSAAPRAANPRADMNVEKIMTRDPICIPPSEPVGRAARRMKEHDVGALPVVEGGRCVGVLTDRDVAVRVAAEGKDPVRVAASDVMSVPAIACTPDTAVFEATRMMAERKIRRLVVEGAEGEVCGLISLGDLALHGAPATDETLRRVCEPS